MKEPTYATYTRSSFPGGGGYQTYASSTSSIGSIGNVFPIVLYVVAALVTSQQWRDLLMKNALIQEC